MKLSTLGLRIAAVAIGLCLAPTQKSSAQATGSLSDLDIEYGELKVAFEKVIEESQQLREVLANTEKTLADMRKNLAAANGETEIFKRQSMELKLRIEALGLETAGGNNAKLEQRLLAAVRELRTLADEKKRLSEALIRLTDAVSSYAKGATGSNAEARLALEVELRNASSALGAATPSAAEATALTPTVTDGMVISTKDDLALVVMNIGSKHGVKVGMPFEVYRSDKKVGNVRVVDVREEIAGAVVQNLISEKDRIKVSDHLKVDAQH
jgi:septal ring factor EnvC (AmiA/AmiB activator)